MSGAMSGGKMLAWHRVFHISPNGIPRLRSFFGRQGRGVWHTPHQMAPQGTRMRISDRSFGSFAP